MAGFRDEFALELARKFASQRDYDNALRYMNVHISTSDDVSKWTSSFYLYLMARNGMVAQAKPIITNLKALERPGMERFLDWYATRFELKSEDSPEPPTAGTQQVAETFE